MPRTPLDAPAGGLGRRLCASWTIAYFGHAAFFRPSMINEGSRNFLFVIINAHRPVLSGGAPCPRGRLDDPESPLGWWIAFVASWGFLWTVFPQMREAVGLPRTSGTIFGTATGHSFGPPAWPARLWLLARGRGIDFLHLLFATGFPGVGLRHSSILQFGVHLAQRSKSLWRPLRFHFRQSQLHVVLRRHRSCPWPCYYFGQSRARGARPTASWPYSSKPPCSQSDAFIVAGSARRRGRAALVCTVPPRGG